MAGDAVTGYYENKIASHRGDTEGLQGPLSHPKFLANIHPLVRHCYAAMKASARLR